MSEHALIRGFIAVFLLAPGCVTQRVWDSIGSPEEPMVCSAYVSSTDVALSVRVTYSDGHARQGEWRLGQEVTWHEASRDPVPAERRVVYLRRPAAESGRRSPHLQSLGSGALHFDDAFLYYYDGSTRWTLTIARESTSGTERAFRISAACLLTPIAIGIDVCSAPFQLLGGLLWAWNFRP